MKTNSKMLHNVFDNLKKNDSCVIMFDYWWIMYAKQIFCALSRRFILKTVSDWKDIFRKLPFSPHFLEPLRLTPDRHWLLILKTIIKRCNETFWKTHNLLSEAYSQKRSSFETLRLFIVHTPSVNLALITLFLCSAFIVSSHSPFTCVQRWLTVRSQ